MIINLTSDFDGINVNRNSFYKSENEREEWLKQAEKIAYEQLVVELSKNGKKISYLILGAIMRII